MFCTQQHLQNLPRLPNERPFIIVGLFGSFQDEGQWVFEEDEVEVQIENLVDSFWTEASFSTVFFTLSMGERFAQLHEDPLGVTPQTSSSGRREFVAKQSRF